MVMALRSVSGLCARKDEDSKNSREIEQVNLYNKCRRWQKW